MSHRALTIGYFQCYYAINMTKLLLKQKKLPIEHLPPSFQKQLGGVVRFVNKNGKTHGLFFDKDSMETLLESFEYASAKFWKEIEDSRQSGTVASVEIENRLGL